MEIQEVNFIKYQEIIETPYQIFSSALFNNLNKDKCDRVRFFLFKEGKYRLGFIGGICKNNLYSPFSAPFGGFCFTKKHPKIPYLENAIELLENWALDKNFSSIHITTPPLLYDQNFISKQINCLYRNGFLIEKLDLNYSYPLNSFKDYEKKIWYNARKNLNIANNSHLSFYHCQTNEEKTKAYDIICKNRASRGFPLRMSWEQVKKTIDLIPANFFLVFNESNIAIASAIIFNISEKVSQVIYWGDLPEYSQLKSMNYLSYKVFEFYSKSKVEYIDIGPSSEDSFPNYGLCDFKESIGCDIQPKLSFAKELS